MKINYNISNLLEKGIPNETTDVVFSLHSDLNDFPKVIDALKKLPNLKSFEYKSENASMVLGTKEKILFDFIEESKLEKVKLPLGSFLDGEEKLRLLKILSKHTTIQDIDAFFYSSNKTDNDMALEYLKMLESKENGQLKKMV